MHVILTQRGKCAEDIAVFTHLPCFQTLHEFQFGTRFFAARCLRRSTGWRDACSVGATAYGALTAFCLVRRPSGMLDDPRRLALGGVRLDIH